MGTGRVETRHRTRDPSPAPLQERKNMGTNIATAPTSTALIPAAVLAAGGKEYTDEEVRRHQSAHFFVRRGQNDQQRGTKDRQRKRKPNGWQSLVTCEVSIYGLGTHSGIGEEWAEAARIEVVGEARYTQLCQELNFASAHLDDIPDREPLRKAVETLEAEAVLKTA